MFRIINQLNQPKHVVYFGLLISVPRHINYLVTDSRGRVLGFNDKPFPSKIMSNKCWKVGSEVPIHLTDVEFDGEWQESIVDVNIT